MLRQCSHDKCGMRDRQKIIKMSGVETRMKSRAIISNGMDSGSSSLKDLWNCSNRKKHKIAVYLGMPTLKKVDFRGILGTRFLAKALEFLKIGKIEGIRK